MKIERNDVFEFLQVMKNEYK